MTKLSLLGVAQNGLIDCTSALPPPKEKGQGANFYFVGAEAGMLGGAVDGGDMGGLEGDTIPGMDAMPNVPISGMPDMARSKRVARHNLRTAA